MCDYGDPGDPLAIFWNDITVMKNQEIERKWLAIPDIVDSIEPDQRSNHITQGYFGNMCRVRITSTRREQLAEITVKISSSDMTRTEFNYPIPLDDALYMLDNIQSISKRRYQLGEGFTLDVFEGPLLGLHIIEKEYQSEESATTDTLPDGWIAIDVTASKSFTNSNLMGMRWDVEEGLLVAGSDINESELLILTGDNEDIMAPPLIIK